MPIILSSDDQRVHDTDICAGNYNILDEMLELFEPGLRTHGVGQGTHIRAAAPEERRPHRFFSVGSIPLHMRHA